MNKLQFNPKAILLLSGVALVVSSQVAQYGLPEQSRWPSLVTLLLGLVLFVMGVYMSGNDVLPMGLADRIASLQNWLGVWRQPIFLCTGPLCAIIAVAASGDGAKMINPAVAVTLWVLGIGLVVAGGWKTIPFRQRLSWQPIVWTVALTVLAFLARGIDTTHFPIVLSGDEGSAGLGAVRFVRGEADNIFTVGWYEFPALYFYIQSLFILLLGQTIPALRILSALIGALTVGGVYLLGRAMFGHKTALAAAIFMSAFHYHIHFSRIGLNNIWDGLWYVIILGALWYGWQNEQRASFLLAGVGLGLSQYFYTGGRMLFALIPVWLLIVGMLDRSRLGRVLPDLLLMAMATVVTVLPLAHYFAGHPDDFMAPMNRTTILGDWMRLAMRDTGQSFWAILSQQIGLGFQAFTYTPLRHWYVPDTPMLRPLPSALFLLGMTLLVVRLRDTRTVLLGLWVIVCALIGGLSESAPAAQRYVSAAPVCALLVGYGLSESISLVGSTLSLRTGLVWAVTLALVMGIAADDLRFYFLEYTPRSDFGGENSMIAQRLANYLQSKSSDWQVVFFGSPRMEYHSIESLEYLAPHIRGVSISAPWNSADKAQISSRNLIFVFLPGHENDLTDVQASYPGGNVLRENTREGKLLYWLYECSLAPP